MSILIDSNTRVLVQGITGREGSFQARQMLACGTKVVAGSTPLRGGEEVSGIPVFDSVADGVAGRVRVGVLAGVRVVVAVAVLLGTEVGVRVGSGPPDSL